MPTTNYYSVSTVTLHGSLIPALIPMAGSNLPIIAFGTQATKINPQKLASALNDVLSASPAAKAELGFAASEGVVIEDWLGDLSTARSEYPGRDRGDTTFVNGADPFEIRILASTDSLLLAAPGSSKESEWYKKIAESIPHEGGGHPKFGAHKGWNGYPSSYIDVLDDPIYNIDIDINLEVGTEFLFPQDTQLSYPAGARFLSIDTAVKYMTEAGTPQSQITNWVSAVFMSGSFEYLPGVYVLRDDIYRNAAADAYRSTIKKNYIRSNVKSGDNRSSILSEAEIYNINQQRIRIETWSGYGSVIGSSLGNYLAKGNAVRGIVYSSVLGEMGERLAGSLVNGGHIENQIDNARTGALNAQNSLVNDVAARMAQASIGTVSSLLTMELGEALGLDGFGAELFNVVGSEVVERAISNLVTKGAGQIWSGFNVKEIPNPELPGGSGSSIVSAIASAVGAFLGAKLGAMVVSPQTQAGVALSSIGSAAGAAWGAKLGNFIAPGVGAFVGYVIGALVGNLFGRKEPKIPISAAATTLSLPYADYRLASAGASNGGNLQLALYMAETARDALNGFIRVVTGDGFRGYVANTDGTDTTQIYGHTGNQIYVKINNVQTNVDSADMAVEYGALHAIRHTNIIGGNIFAKRAIFRSSANTLTDLLGDLQVSDDYSNYSNNRELIEGFIKDAYGSLTEADQSAYAGNKALIDKVSMGGLPSLNSTELSVWNANAAVFNKILSALDAQEPANAWIVTLQRVDELGLDQFTASDLYGGLQGFVDSMNMRFAKARYENITITGDVNNLTLSLPTSVGGAFEILAQSTNDGHTVTIQNFAATMGYSAWDAGNSSYQGSNGNDVAIFASSSAGVSIDDFYTNGDGAMQDVGGTWTPVYKDINAGGTWSGEYVDVGGTTTVGEWVVDKKTGEGHYTYIYTPNYQWDPNAGTFTPNSGHYEDVGGTWSGAFVDAGGTWVGGYVDAGGTWSPGYTDIGGTWSQEWIVTDKKTGDGYWGDVYTPNWVWSEQGVYTPNMVWDDYGVYSPNIVWDANAGNYTPNYQWVYDPPNWQTVDVYTPNMQFVSTRYGNDGNDIFVGGSGSDTINGRYGNDWLEGGGGADVLHAGDGGKDVLLGGGGNDTLYGDHSVTAYLAGGDGNDIIWGGSGVDTMIGGAGADSLDGGGGDDVLVVDYNDGAVDTLVGGYGTDAVSYELFGAGVTVNLNLAVGGVLTAYGDQISGVEGITGSEYNDVLTGLVSAGGILRGLGGDDQLYAGNSGSTTLEGGSGADLIVGGAGIDTASYEHSASSVYIDLTTGKAAGGDAEGDTLTNIEGLIGSRYNDQLKGGKSLDGGAGDDWLYATTTTTIYNGGEGQDFVDFSKSTSAVTVIYNTSHAVGTAPVNNMNSYSGIEGIVGSNFADTLTGNVGSQVFIGGGGNDYLTGGAGADTFVFGIGEGVDTIIDDKNDNNELVFGAGITWNDLWFDRAGPVFGSSGTFSIGAINASNYALIRGFSPEKHNNTIKTVTLDGGSQIDISSICFLNIGTTGADTRYGSKDDDIIVGGAGNDALWAGLNFTDRGDILIGGQGDDALIGRSGDDQYVFERGMGHDTITETGGDDTLVFGSTVVADDVILKVVDSDLYVGIRDANNLTYEANQVADWVKITGGGIRYVEKAYTSGNILSATYQSNTVEFLNVAGTQIDVRKVGVQWNDVITWNYDPSLPIVFDLEGDGLDLSLAEDSPIVGRVASGGMMSVAWAGPTDGFLAVDRDGDGQITKLSEISFAQDKEGATSDLEGLKTWDSNGDGMISAADVGWSRLKLFVDKNQNGRSNAGELISLQDGGIAGIRLNGVATGRTAQDGIESFVQNTMTFIRTDGSSGDAYDVALARKLINSDGRYAGEYQEEWGEKDDDAELGVMLNDARSEIARVKAAKAKLGAAAVDGLANVAKQNTTAGRQAKAQLTAALNAVTAVELETAKRTLSYDDVKAAAQFDFTGSEDPINARSKKIWADVIDPARKARLKADLANGVVGDENVEAMKARRPVAAVEDLRESQLQRSGPPASTVEDVTPAEDFATMAFGDDQAGAPSYDNSAYTPADTLASGQVEGAQDDYVPQTNARSVADSDWWRTGQTPGSIGVVPISLGELLGKMSAGSTSEAERRYVPASAAEARDALLLRQGLAAFAGDAGGSPAVWRRAGEVEGASDFYAGASWSMSRAKAVA